MHYRRKIALILLVAAVYLPGLMRAGSEWHMPEATALPPGGSEPYFSEGFVTPPMDGKIAHVASLAELAGDGMAAAWYSGSREGARDVSIYLSVMDPDTGIWSVPRVVMDRERASRDLGRYIKKVGNPLLHTDGSGRLWLFFSSISAGGWSGSTISCTSSDDLGATWSKAERLQLSPFLNLTNNVKNKPVALKDGSFLIPVYHEFVRKFSEALRFDPGTGSYEKRRLPVMGRAIQPAFVRRPDGSLTAIMRNMDSGHAYRSTSADGGRTWAPLEETGLLNPDSGLDAIVLTDGRMLAAANDTEEGRQRLSLLVSADGGMNWKRLFKVEDGEAGSEFSYPFLLRDREGNIHLAYTWRRERIRHAVFNEAWINRQEDDG